MKQPVMTNGSAKNFRFAADLNLTGIMGDLHPHGTTLGGAQWSDSPHLRPTWIWSQTVNECRSTETGARQMEAAGQEESPGELLQHQSTFPIF